MTTELLRAAIAASLPDMADATAATIVQKYESLLADRRQKMNGQGISDLTEALDAYEKALADEYDDGGEGDPAAMAAARLAFLNVLRKLKTDSDMLDWLDLNIFHRELDKHDSKFMKDTSMWVFFSPIKTGYASARERIKLQMARQRFA